MKDTESDNDKVVDDKKPLCRICGHPDVVIWSEDGTGLCAKHLWSDDD